MLLTYCSLQAWCQNWIAGSTVNEPIAGFSLQSAGCIAPDADAVVNLPVSSVNGVQYYLHLTQLNGSTGVDIQPYGINLIAGDSLLINHNNNEIFLNASTAGGNADFVLVANGIPTSVGQPHPCGLNNNFLSNGTICPDFLFNTVVLNCTVAAPSSLETSEFKRSTISYTTSGWTYTSFSSNDFLNCFSSDGRLIFSTAANRNQPIILPINQAGIYFILSQTNQYKIVQP